ncbi:2-polyprenyl-6-methoxyphenol hydroxylase-like FAD-dependent oxidoreductase [Rathayibacter tanaceti]|uniref:2-polyprenyl-6-methoxyphenol hydroxylase-like FAD-dependent oxidoreductase n=5 Tax=Rathayibacter tanaceti TaxID=1671680 RepID=A0ACD2XM96_9MICO|nr:NAD(P)/FAD-dependent oxidoreductase [Rathayibacter tanaceti]QHC54858.1 FAD-dependent monooxygenase [Rathayibacter tanaceti]TCO38393.1 2-polyprenyl-6-methoxyphenol hydroxylase-like FAD-dependent oxidoreductase [Rathayibacter tanaceti]
MTAETDVLVVGGGPVGLFLGALLARAGVDVQVWEQSVDPPRGSRAIGIHPPSLNAFAAVGADLPVLGEAARVHEGVARSRGRTLGALSFARASATHPYVVTLDQHRTEAVLRERLHAAAAEALRPGTALTGLRLPRGRVEASGTGPGGEPLALRAAFVVGADGARSTVRELLGIGTSGRDYPDRYVMGDFADPEPARLVGTALVDVGPAGVVESFPLPGGRRRYVALSGPDRALGAPAWRPEEAPDQVAALALSAAVRERTGAAADPGSCSMLSGFRVRRREAERMGSGRAVLIGDAAHEISPIGGQGMNLGWLDAAELAPLLAEAVRDGAAGPWPGFARRRTAVARRAARQAEANMALGRPLGVVAHRGREAFLRAALALPTADVLARIYAMRWS